MKTRCPHCGQEYKVPKSTLGEDVGCHICNGRFVISKDRDTSSLAGMPDPESIQKIACGFIVVIIVAFTMYSCMGSCSTSPPYKGGGSPSVVPAYTHNGSSDTFDRAVLETIFIRNESEDDDYTGEEITGAFGFYFGAKIDRGRASRQQHNSGLSIYIYGVGAPRENYRNFSDCRIIATADGTIYGIVAFKRFATERERKEEINAIKADFESRYGVKPRSEFLGEFCTYKIGDTWVDIDVHYDKNGEFIGLQFTQEDKYIYPQ